MYMRGHNVFLKEEKMITYSKELRVKRVLLSLVIVLFAVIQVAATTVSGVISDSEGNPIDNIRVKFRGGIEGDSRAFNTDWYHEDMIRVEEDGAYSFTVPDPGYSIDSNHIFMLFTISGVDAATKIWNTTESDRFLIRDGVGDTVVNLVTTKIVFSPMVVKVQIDDQTPVSGVGVGATLLVNAGGTEAGITGDDGLIVFDGAIPGDYRVTANKVGYTVVSESYTLAENGGDTLTITVEETDVVPTTGSIVGTLKDGEGNPIAGGVSVIKFGGKSEREVFVAVSDANGNFLITNIPDIYLGVEGKIETGADGYQDAEEMWTVATTNLTVDYVLAEVGDNGQGTSNTFQINNSANNISIMKRFSSKGVTLEFSGFKNSSVVNLFSLNGKKIITKSLNKSSNKISIPNYCSQKMLILQIKNGENSKSFKYLISK